MFTNPRPFDYELDDPDLGDVNIYAELEKHRIEFDFDRIASSNFGMSIMAPTNLEEAKSDELIESEFEKSKIASSQLRKLSAERQKRHKSAAKKVVGIVAIAGSLVGLQAFRLINSNGDQNLVPPAQEVNSHPIDARCLFFGYHIVRATSPDIDLLAAQIKGIGLAGVDSKCLGAAEADIKTLNDLNSNTKIVLGSLYTIADRVKTPVN